MFIFYYIVCIYIILYYIKKRAAPTRRASAIWKGVGEDDSAFRAEILSQFIPKETDDWMAWESQFLSQFTRIFPKETSSKDQEDDAKDEEEDAKDDEDDQDDDQQQQQQSVKVKDENAATSSTKNTNSSSNSLPSSSSASQINSNNNNNNVAVAKRKPVSFEDIIYEVTIHTYSFFFLLDISLTISPFLAHIPYTQVFLQDKRQTMRMYHPLANKARSVAGATDPSQTGLPPLDMSKNPLPGSIAANLVKGGSSGGWKAPPKIERPTPAPVQPTQSQLDAAKRLSQGLSVKKHSTRDRRDYSHSHSTATATATAGMLLNLSQQQHLQLQLQQQHQQHSSDYNEDLLSLVSAVNMDESNIPPRIKRLMEQNRIIRLKYENSRANQAAVLRQQVYKFDNDTTPSTTVPPPQFVLDQSNLSFGQAAAAAAAAAAPQNSRMLNNVSNGYPSQFVAASSNPTAFRNSNIMLGAGMKSAALNNHSGNINSKYYGKSGISSFDNHSSTDNYNQHKRRTIDNLAPRMTDQPSQEELLKHLLPGWF